MLGDDAGLLPSGADRAEEMTGGGGWGGVEVLAQVAEEEFLFGGALRWGFGDVV